MKESLDESDRRKEGNSYWLYNSIKKADDVYRPNIQLLYHSISLSNSSISLWWERWFWSSNAKDILRRDSSIRSKWFSRNAQHSTSLFRVAYSNELMSRVLMNSQTEDVVSRWYWMACWIRIYDTWARANCRIKTGPLATEERQRADVGNKLTSLNDIESGGASQIPIPVQTADNVDMLTSKYEWEQSSGTPEKNQTDSSEQSKDWTVFDLDSTNSSRRVVYSWDGGKIADQAKAGSNSPDSVTSEYPIANYTPLTGGQNSVLLLLTNRSKNSKTGLNHTRDWHSDASRKSFDQQPWKFNMKEMEDNVMKDQTRLVEYATKSENDLNGETLKYQRNLCLKLDFRITAVQRVLSNQGGRTPRLQGWNLLCTM